MPTESLIREGFVPIFLAFPFQQVDFGFNEDKKEIKYLVIDRTFYQKTRPYDKKNGSGALIDVFPFAKRVKVTDFRFLD